MTSPAPTYDADLVMVSQRLTHAAYSRSLFLTYACEDVGAVGNATTIATSLQTQFKTNWTSQFDSNVTIREASVLLGDGSTTPMQGVSTGAAAAGTQAIGSLPPNCNILVQKKTGLGGRSNRGRLYFPHVMNEVDVDEAGIWSAGGVSGMQTIANAWRTALVGLNLPMVICQRNVNNNPTPPPAKYVAAYRTGPAVTSLVVDQLIASQRRRIGR